ncbi:hypothetical protein HK102_006527, partial [Quaeritorhiza haematococci]
RGSDVDDDDDEPDYLGELSREVGVDVDLVELMDQRWFGGSADLFGSVKQKIDEILNSTTIDEHIEEVAETLGKNIAQRLLARGITVSVEMLTAAGVAALAGWLTGNPAGIPVFVTAFLVRLSIDPATAEKIAKEVISTVIGEWNALMSTLTYRGVKNFARMVWRSFAKHVLGRTYPDENATATMTATATATMPMMATATVGADGAWVTPTGTPDSEDEGGELPAIAS